LGDVRAAVESVAARFDVMERRVQRARQGLAANRSSLTEGARSELATFDAVAEDLARDVQTLRLCARESVRSLDKSQDLAQVYDALADGLFEFEIATAFIASLVERLAG
jgi:aromatic ring hydroxylase